MGRVCVMKYLLLAVLLFTLSVQAELPVEPIPNVVVLPSVYPDRWVFAHDIVHGHFLNERVILFDADTGQYIGQINASSLAQFKVGKTRSEIYVAETFYSRGTRGERTDVVTIYDKSTLAPTDEILLPGGKRIITPPMDNLAEFTRDEQFLLILNFTPAASVSVVDLDKRQVVNEIQLPGCSLIYATGKRGFSSICSDGAMITYTLNVAGQVTRTSKSDPFINIDDDPLFEKPALINGTAYFPSFKGSMQPIDFRHKTPKFGEVWNLVTGKDNEANYRPGGWQLMSQHEGDDEIYVLMHKDGFNGSQKDVGGEVWVFDPARQRRTRRIALKNPGISIKITTDKEPLMLVVNEASHIDIYEAHSGLFKHQISGLGQSPFLFYGAQP